jgi:hypothetical protein
MSWKTLLADLGFATPSDRAAVIDTLHGVIIVRRFLQLGEYPQYHIFDDCIGKAAAVVTDKLVKLDSNEAMLAASEPVVQPIRRTPGVSTRPPSSDPPRSGLVPVQALQRHAQPLQQAAVRVQPNVGSQALVAAARVNSTAVVPAPREGSPTPVAKRNTATSLPTAAISKIPLQHPTTSVTVGKRSAKAPVLMEHAVAALAGRDTIVGNTMVGDAVGDLLQKCGFTDRVTRRAALRALIDAGHICEIGRTSAGQQLYKVTVSPHPAVAAHSYRVPLPVSGKLDAAEASVAPSSTRTIVDVLREVALVDGRIPGTTLGAALKAHGLATTTERREATERLQQEGLLARVANDKHGLPVFQLALVPPEAPTSESLSGERPIVGKARGQPDIDAERKPRQQHQTATVQQPGAFRCTGCTSTFIDADALADHMEHANHGTWFQCLHPGCDWSYVTQRLLSKHHTKQHGDQQSSQPSSTATRAPAARSVGSHHITDRDNVSDRGTTVVTTQPLQIIEQEAVQQLRAYTGKRLQPFQLAAILAAAGAATPKLRAIATHRLIKRGVVQETVDGDRKSYVVAETAEQTAAAVLPAKIVDALRSVTVDETITSAGLGQVLRSCGFTAATQRRHETERLLREGLLARLANDEHGHRVFRFAASDGANKKKLPPVANMADKCSTTGVVKAAGTTANDARDRVADPTTRSSDPVPSVAVASAHDVSPTPTGRCAGHLNVAEASVASSTRTIVDVLREVALVDGRIPGTALGAALKGHGLATTRERREITERLLREGLLARVANDKHGLPVFQLAQVLAASHETKSTSPSTSVIVTALMSCIRGTSVILERDLDALLQRHGAATAQQRDAVLQRLVDEGAMTPWAEMNDDGETERRVLLDQEIPLDEGPVTASASRITAFLQAYMNTARPEAPTNRSAPSLSTPARLDGFQQQKANQSGSSQAAEPPVASSVGLFGAPARTLAFVEDSSFRNVPIHSHFPASAAEQSSLAPQSVNAMQSVLAGLTNYARAGYIRGTDLDTCQINAGVYNVVYRRAMTQVLIREGYLANPVADERKLPTYRLLAGPTTDANEVARRVSDVFCAQHMPLLGEDLLERLLSEAGAVKHDVREAAKGLLIELGVIRWVPTSAGQYRMTDRSGLSSQSGQRGAEHGEIATALANNVLPVALPHVVPTDPTSNVPVLGQLIPPQFPRVTTRHTAAISGSGWLCGFR